MSEKIHLCYNSLLSPVWHLNNNLYYIIMESLFTHQDGKYGHFHKSIGFLALTHFLVRFTSVLMHGSMGFNNTNICYCASSGDNIYPSFPADLLQEYES
jgi:hypothetical protein